MTTSRPINHFQAIPDVFKALEQVREVIDDTRFDTTIHHLVQLRASQINVAPIA